MNCRKCEKEIEIHPIKKCYWCPECRLRGPAVDEDTVVESQGGITMNMVREEIRKQIAEAMGEKTKLDGLTEDKIKELSWREEAKSLGIEVYDKVNSRPRLKVDVLAEIASKKLSPQEEDANDSPVTAETS
jgi:hypothetical protein